MEEIRKVRITPWYIDYTNIKFWWLYIIHFATPRLIYLEISKGGIKFRHRRIFDISSIIYFAVLIPLIIINLYSSFALNTDIQNQFFIYFYTIWMFLAAIFVCIIPPIILSRNINIELDDIVEYGSMENLEKSRAFRFVVLFDLIYFLLFRKTSVYIKTRDNNIYALLGVNKEELIQGIRRFK